MNKNPIFYVPRLFFTRWPTAQEFYRALRDCTPGITYSEAQWFTDRRVLDCCQDARERADALLSLNEAANLIFACGASIIPDVQLQLAYSPPFQTLRIFYRRKQP